MKPRAMFAAGVFAYVVSALVVVEWDFAGHCHKEPFRPGAPTYAALFPVGLIPWFPFGVERWQRLLAEAPVEGVSCDDVDMATMDLAAIIAPLNGLIWTWAIRRTLRTARRRGADGNRPACEIAPDGRRSAT